VTAARVGVANRDNEEAVDHFFARVAGETSRNSDGSDRQAVIARCRVGDLLVLEHEPDNPQDINAVRVITRRGEQIGYLERHLAGEVVSRRAKGWSFHALVADVARAGGQGPYGVALLIVVEHHGVTDAEVALYGRRVLARDREIRPRGAERPVRRMADEPTTRGGRLVVIAAAVVVGLAVAITLVLLR
jgi:hypothetical protein